MYASCWCLLQLSLYACRYQAVIPAALGCAAFSWLQIHVIYRQHYHAGGHDILPHACSALVTSNMSQRNDHACSSLMAISAWDDQLRFLASQRHKLSSKRLRQWNKVWIQFCAECEILYAYEK